MLSVKNKEILLRWSDAKSQINGQAKLLAVTKNQPIESIKALLDAGQLLFGENRLQEAEKKWLHLKTNLIQLHLIGPLQTNKVRYAVALFDVIQTLDRPNLALKLREELGKMERSVKLMVQVNLGSEPQKSGISLDKAESFIDSCLNELQLPIIGVMGIPPIAEDPTPYFQKLFTLANSTVKSNTWIRLKS
jgi:pyridoxal phosphate enzyme (YggS family)